MAPLYKYIIDDFVLHYVFSYLVLSFYMLLFSAFYLCIECTQAITTIIIAYAGHFL